jgi:hypothetical protein
MISDTEQKLLEPDASTVGFEYMMYVPTSFSQRSGLLYRREHAPLSAWNPLVDDGDLFRLAVDASSFNLQRIIDSASGSGQQNLEIRCDYIRELLVRAVAKIVADPPSTRGSHRMFKTFAVGECQK